MTTPVIEPIVEACNLNHVTWRTKLGAVAFTNASHRAFHHLPPLLFCLITNFLSSHSQFALRSHLF